MNEIDRKSSIPIYIQLANKLKQDIIIGTFKENDKIFTESKFCEIYKISRTTVRQFLNILVNEGYIHKIHGKGSYVCASKIYQNRSNFTSFYDDILNIEKKPISNILSLKIKFPDSQIKQKMQLSDETQIVELIWKRYSNNEALIYETVYLNYSLVKGIEHCDLKSKKLYQLLSEVFSIKISHGHELFYPCKLTQNEAKLLNLQEQDLGMKFERTIYSENKILEYTNSVVRGDKFIYTTNFKFDLKNK